MKKSLLLLIFILICAFVPANGTEPVVIAMCRPQERQIENIENLYEKDLLPLDKMTLVCIYHEDELTDYQPSYEYVREHKLTWVRFEIIRGQVGWKRLFVKNAWSDQFKAIFDSVDAIIFTGGSDIPPCIYGEENDLLTSAMTPCRTMYEASFQFHLLGGSQNPNFEPFLQKRPNFPVLGICLGSQTMNIAAGGSLYQDIPSQIYGLKTVEQVLALEQNKIHSSLYIRKMHPAEKHFPPAFHQIKLMLGSKFIKDMGMKTSDNPFVLTSHHQCVKKLGASLKIAATSMDGKVVEAIEHKKFKNVLGVQFHPEYYQLYKKGAFFCSEPGGKVDFNLRLFLKDNPPSMRFHRNIWKWLANAAISSKHQNAVK